MDEYHLFLTPVLVGGGTPGLPDGVHVALELRDERRFGNGMIFAPASRHALAADDRILIGVRIVQ